MANQSSVLNSQKRAPGLGERLTPQTLVLIGVFLSVLVVVWRVTGHYTFQDILQDPIILFFPALGAGLILLRRPPLGLIALVVASLSVSFELQTGTQTRLNAGMLILGLLIGLWVFNLIVDKRRSLPANSRTFIPLILFVLLSTISFLVGQLPWFVFAQKASINAQVGGLALFWLAAGAFLLTANQIDHLRWLERITWVFLLIAGLYIFVRIIPGTAAISEKILQRGVFTNSIFWLWVASIAFSQALFNRKLPNFIRALLMALVGATFYIRLIEEAGWTSGWLPAAVAVGMILWVSGSRYAWLTLVAGIGFLASKADTIQRLLLVGDNEYSLVTRLEAWRIIAQIVKVNPLFGLGPANYYWYTPLYSILGYTVQFNSHNNYMDLLAQVGILGLAAFLWFAWEVWRVGWSLRSRAPEGFAQAYVYGALGGLVGTLTAGMLGDWFLPFIYNIGFSGFRASLLAWLFLGGLVAIARLVVAPDSNPGTQEVS